MTCKYDNKLGYSQKIVALIQLEVVKFLEAETIKSHLNRPLLHNP